MEKIPYEAVIAFMALCATGIGAYVKLKTELESVKIKCQQLREQVSELKDDSRKRDAMVAQKFDLFIEKFEMMNEKINQFISEFSHTK